MAVVASVQDASAFFSSCSSSSKQTGEDVHGRILTCLAMPRTGSCKLQVSLFRCRHCRRHGRTSLAEKVTYVQGIDLGCQDEVVLRQASYSMRADVNADAVPADQVEVGVMALRLRHLGDAFEEIEALDKRFGLPGSVQAEPSVSELLHDLPTGHLLH